jgi:hypothetical protein
MIFHNFQCPYCFETIEMQLDVSVSTQQYTEDCEVCCRPIEVHYEQEDGELMYFHCERELD